MLQSASKPTVDAETQNEERYTITQLAREFGITTRAMRFYESQGLISEARSGTIRIYSSRDRVRLKLVLRAGRWRRA